MEELFNPVYLDGFVRITVATLLGLLIGLERSIAQKTAGMRTYSLIAMGSALFVVISEYVYVNFEGITNFDPLRVAAQIIPGIGFVGAGLVIIKDSRKIRGLTTAAGLWVAAGIGMASGFKLYSVAIFTTILTLFIFSILWYVDRIIRRLSGQVYHHQEDGKSYPCPNEEDHEEECGVHHDVRESEDER